MAGTLDLEPVKPTASIAVPGELGVLIDELVADYAKKTGEQPGVCRRAIELAVLTRGARSIAAELAQDRNGWRPA